MNELLYGGNKIIAKSKDENEDKGKLPTPPLKKI